MANEQRKRLQRMAAALAGKDLDPAGAMETIPALREVALSDTPVEGQPEIGRQLVGLRRWTDRVTPMARRPLEGPIRMNRSPISGPLPDPAWDRLFGALQVSELQAASQGKRFGLNYGDFGNDTTHDYTPPGYGPRRRLLNPEDRLAARSIGAAQQAARRRG